MLSAAVCLADRLWSEPSGSLPAGIERDMERLTDAEMKKGWKKIDKPVIY